MHQGGNDDDKKYDHRKVWGSGFRAGYQAGLAGGAPMKQAKLERMIKDQTVIARRVFNCVPKEVVWSKKQIHVEAHRQGIQQGMKVVDGCLKSLKQTGLIKEPAPGYFCQVKASQDTPKLESVKAKPKVETMNKKAEEPDPFDKIRATLEGLDEYADAVAECLHEKYNDIRRALDEVELQCMESQETNEDELEKLRALRDAMSALTGGNT